MGIGIALENFDDLFYNQGRRDKVILNDLNDSTKEDRQSIEQLLYTRYETTEFLSNVPSCGCGKTTGAYAVGLVGFLCPHCRTHVLDATEQDLEPLLWMRSPAGVAPLINPNFFAMLMARFKFKGFDVIQWFCDTTYKPNGKVPPELVNIEALGFVRGYNNFYQNFDAIIAGLLSLKVYRKTPKNKKEEVDALPILIPQQRNCLFSDYLPLPNRALIVLEKTNLGNYNDPTTIGVVDAMQTMINIDSPLNNYKVRRKENSCVKAIVSLTKFYDETYRKRMAPKEGIFRKHVYGSRSHFSFRAVIQSLTDKHDYDEVHISWGIGVSVLSIHLKNKLLKRGWVPRAVNNLLYEYAQKYHPLLDELFQELIRESPYKGLPHTFQRN